MALQLSQMTWIWRIVWCTCSIQWPSGQWSRITWDRDDETLDHIYFRTRASYIIQAWVVLEQTVGGQCRVGCFQLSENWTLKHLIPFDSWMKEVNECNGHSKITQKYDSDWILLIPFDSSNQMIYLMIAVTCVWFGNQKESIIQLMIHSFMVNQITEWMILNWKQPSCNHLYLPKVHTAEITQPLWRSEIQ